MSATAMSGWMESNMLIGYARTSTVTQEAGLEAQERDIRAAGAEKLFGEQVSSVADREQLEAALDYARAGDVLVVTKLDRLARSIRDLCSIVDRLTAKGVSLRILGMGLDTATANGQLMLNVLGSGAQFEREVMLERQREGIAKAKVEGKFKGRAPTARNKAEEVKALMAAGDDPRGRRREAGDVREECLPRPRYLRSCRRDSLRSLVRPSMRTVQRP
jgi:DNA invertase Pin-like site-specific DNA recombinase